MANTLYPKFKRRALTTGGALVSGVVKAQLVDLAQYTYSAAHEYLIDLPGAARVGAAVTLANKSVSDLGVFDADDLSYSGLTATPSIEALVLYVDTADESTSHLIAYLDTASGLPITAGAAGGTVTWDNGANRILAI